MMDYHRECAVCGGPVECLAVERRVNTVVRHYRCRDCPDIGGHLVTDLDDSVRHVAGPVFEGKQDALVASALTEEQRAGRAD